MKAVFLGGPFDGEEHEIPRDVALETYTVRVSSTEPGLPAWSIYKKAASFVDGVVVFVYEGPRPDRPLKP